MNQEIINEIETIVKSNIVFRFGLELANTQDVERKKSIQNILQHYSNSKEENNVKDKIDKMFEQIDKQIFTQKWSKLSDFHKEIKIKEYIEEKYINHKNKNKLLELLLDYLKNKKLKTDKIINYDSKISKIIEIKNLIELDDNFIIETKTKKNIKKK